MRLRVVAAPLMATSLVFVAAQVASAHEQGDAGMQSLVCALDEAAQHANDRVHHGLNPHDPMLLRSIARFADRASRFHHQMDSSGMQPRQAENELQRLLSDARDVQFRIQNSSAAADADLITDWNRAVRVLNRMIRLYSAEVTGRSWNDGYVAPRYGRAPGGYFSPQPGERVGFPQGNPSADRGPSPDSGQLAALADDLVERTDRIHNYALASAGPFQADPQQRAALDAILHFRNQARVFRERLKSGLDASRLTGNANHLAEDARRSAALVQQSQLSPQIQADWDQAMQLVSQIQAIAAH